MVSARASGQVRRLASLGLAALGIAAALVAALLWTGEADPGRRAAAETSLAPRPRAVERIELRRAAQELTLVRAAEGWRLTAPVDDLADASRVEALLAALQRLQLRRRLDAQTEALSRAELGLAPARLEIALHHEAKTTRLALGRRNLFDGQVVVAITSAGEEIVGTLDLAQASALDVGLTLLRERRLCPLDLSAVTALSLGGASAAAPMTTLRREAAADATTATPVTWRVATPEAPVVDLSDVDALLLAFEAARFDRVVYERGSASPEASREPQLVLELQSDQGRCRLEAGWARTAPGAAAGDEALPADRAQVWLIDRGLVVEAPAAPFAQAAKLAASWREIAVGTKKNGRR